jgi:hypothetical protein
VTIRELVLQLTDLDPELQVVTINTELGVIAVTGLVVEPLRTDRCKTVVRLVDVGGIRLRRQRANARAIA